MKGRRGTPPWMATFADLAILLMCFFVLLLSFSEMDVMKFRQIAGSMRHAFGIQTEYKVKDVPRGTSVIAHEFTPGRPTPTPIKVLQQHTDNNQESSLDFWEGETPQAGGVISHTAQKIGGKGQDSSNATTLYDKVQSALSTQIDQQDIEVERFGQQVIIRLQDPAMFPKDSAFLQPKLTQILSSIGQALEGIPGEIQVFGHTDVAPMQSQLYRSKWDLSSQRAVTVLESLLALSPLSRDRMKVVALADTAPRFVDPQSEWERQANRRVEIVLSQGKPHEKTMPLTP